MMAKGHVTILLLKLTSLLVAEKVRSEFWLQSQSNQMAKC